MVDFLGVPGTGGVRVHIRSGAVTPSMPRPLREDLTGGLRTARAARCAVRRAPRRPAAAPGTSRRTGGSHRPVPRGSGRPGAAHAAPRRSSAPAGTRRCCGSAHPLCRAVSSSRCGGVGGDAEIGGVAGQRSRAGRARIARSRPGFRWTPTDHSARSMSMVVSTERPDQRVAGGVDADRLDEVVEGDDGAGPLAHPHRLTVADQVDHLADQHLDGVGVVAERGGGGLEPARCSRGGRRRACRCTGRSRAARLSRK